MASGWTNCLAQDAVLVPVSDKHICNDDASLFVGCVDYEKLLNSPDSLARFRSNVEHIVAVRDSFQVPSKAHFIFLLNAYNTLCMEKTLEKLQDNREFQGNTSWWKRMKFFYWQTCSAIGLSLYKLENEVIRKHYSDDPRLHFYLNCCSYSCPQICSVYLTEENFDKVMDFCTQDFVQQQGALDILPNGHVSLSSIFDWYAKDFESSGGILKFVTKHASEEQQAAIPDGNPKLKYQEYDWRLNSAQNFGVAESSNHEDGDDVPNNRFL